MFKGMNLIEFGKRFQTNGDCLQYLMDIKWAEGFKCSKCGSLKYWKGKHGPIYVARIAATKNLQQWGHCFTRLNFRC